MIISVEGGSADTVAAARETLQTLARQWGRDLTDEPPPDTTGTAGGDGKAIDPVALAALLVSLPSAALAVADLADRITKRRRARQLIDQARQLSTQHVTVYLITPSRRLELDALDPGQLLELTANDPHLG